MTAGRMTDCNHSIEIEIEFGGDGLEMIRRVGHVFKCSRPSASGMAEPPVFDIPRGDAHIRQRDAYMAYVVESVCRAPKPAVDHDGCGMRPPLLGQPQVPKVKLARPIADAMIRRRRSVFKNLS